SYGQPLRVLVEFLLRSCREHASRLRKADVLADLCLQAAPDVHALDHHGQLANVAPLLAHPPPVAAGLLAGNVALLAQRGLDALAGEKPGRGNADDAAAYDHDVGRLRNSRRWN